MRGPLGLATVGGLALLSQPLVIAVQLVVGARWEVPYDLSRNTVSDLGAVGCGTLAAAGGPIEVCSPWHAGMNATFVVIGALLTVGALLSWPTVVRVTGGGGGARMSTVSRVVAVTALAVAGVSSAAVGFVPIDVDAGLHTLVATPLFVAQPVALLLLGAVLVRRSGERHWGSTLLLLGAVAAAGGVAFAATLVSGDVGGLYERIALWPCHLGVAVVGWTVLQTDRARSGAGVHPLVWEDAA